MRQIKWALSILSILIISIACQKQLDNPSNPSLSDQLSVPGQIAQNGSTCGSPLTLPIMDLGENQIAAVSISNDDENIYVNVIPAEGKYLNAIILNYGTRDEVTDAITNPINYDICQGPFNFDFREFYPYASAVLSKTVIIPRAAVGECFDLSLIAKTLEIGGDQTSTQCGYPDDFNSLNDIIVVGSANYQSQFEYCAQDCPPTECEPLRTQTPGGWGAKPEGNNPGTYLAANFATSFPNGLTVGCDGGFKITLTSAKAIETLLPTGGKAVVLKASYTNPAEIKNVLVGHIVALTLSVIFDQDDADFGAGDNEFGSMVIKSGTFAGKTVLEFWKIANDVLGGCNANYTPEQVLETATAINENYVDGKMDKGYLECKK